jgi:hypothetical protein
MAIAGTIAQNIAEMTEIPSPKLKTGGMRMHTYEVPATPNITLFTNSRRTILLLHFCPYPERNASQFSAAGHAFVRATDWQCSHEQSEALSSLCPWQ